VDGSNSGRKTTNKSEKFLNEFEAGATKQGKKNTPREKRCRKKDSRLRKKERIGCLEKNKKQKESTSPVMHWQGGESLRKNRLKTTGHHTGT